MLKTSRSLMCLLTCAGMAGAAMAAPPLSPPDFESIPDFEAATVANDDSEALALANKMGLNTPRTPSGLRGLPVCPSIITDLDNCHPANLGLAAPFSGTRTGAFRVMENVTPTSTNATRICWIGRYGDRAAPFATDESFQIRIFADDNGFPNLTAPLYQQTFRQTGTAGTDLLEMDCLDGENCPGTSSPAAGGHYVYSAAVTTGFPMTANQCYWIEIACTASSELGQNWAWVASTSGTDLTSLQALDGAYNLFTRIVNDRAVCITGGVNSGAGNCVIAPQPPICSNDPSSGIAYAGSTTGGRASWPGSDSRGLGWTPFQRADSFTFDTPTTVTNVCFRGFWNTINSNGTAGTPAAPIPENPGFRVAYFTHNPNDAVPENLTPIAEFAIGDPGVTFVWDGTDLSSFTHPPVEFDANTCYWISIGRIQSTPLAGEPNVRVWAWRLTPGVGVPTADNRTSTRTVGTGPSTAWGVTIFRTASTAIPACDPINSNYTFLFNAGPTTAATCTPIVCSIEIPPGATPNAEPECALAGNLNGGCNLATPVFTTLSCGETLIGSGSTLLTATCGGTRDTDWYHLTVTQESEVTVTINSQFAGIAGYGGLLAGITNPTGSCAEYSGGITPFVAIGSCTPVTITRTLQPGTWLFFVASNFGDVLQCNNSNNLYTLSAECAGGPGTDCNDNGIDDATEIAGGARDCFNPLVVATPNTMGGSDGALDECQCVANWDRDGSVNSNDISAFISSWLNAVGGGGAVADINCDGLNNSNDISAFISVWLAAVQNTIPTDGCP